MATVDLSRYAFDPRKHYAGVRMQQGRVLTDDDFNEADVLAAEDDRLTRVDVIGPAGTPDNGFKVDGPSFDSDDQIEFTLQAGTFYVGGVRTVLNESITLSAQPDFLRQVAEDRDRGGSAHTLVYLEVWQQPVSAVEDAELFEVALGGPDTAQRIRTMARIRTRGTALDECSAAFAELTSALAADLRGTYDPSTAALRNDLTLHVDFVDTDGDDLCAPQAAEGYVAADNQAIRVQLVAPPNGATPAALTWGFDNGAPLYRVFIENVTVTVEGVSVTRTRVTFLTEPKDQAHWALQNQVAEIVPFTAILDPNREIVAEGHGRCEPQVGGELLSFGDGHLARVVVGYNPTLRTIELDGAFPSSLTTLAPALADAANGNDGEPRPYNAFLRLWDRGTDLTSLPRIGVVPGVPVVLGNTGLRVRLEGTMLRADAHWIIAARPHTPQLVIPWVLQNDTSGGSAHGITTFLAPLALVTWGASEADHTVHDCRIPFRPLTRQRGCCTVTVGDGETSHGDYTSIQAAIDALPPTGGEVCVLPGTYDGPVHLFQKSNVRIHGCGTRSVVVSEDPEGVLIQSSSGIVIEHLRIEALAGWGVRVWDDGGDLTTDVEIRSCEIVARDLGAVTFDSGDGLKLVSSELVAQPLEEDPPTDSPIGRLPLVSVQATNVIVRDNKLDATQVGPSPTWQGVGGIRIAGNSETVRIESNRIIGGKGNGITLGSTTTERSLGPWWLFLRGYFSWNPVGPCTKRTPPPPVSTGPTVTETVISEGVVEDVQILRNEIVDMGGDGIGVAWIFDDTDGSDLPDDVILVIGLRILGNRIEGCNQGEIEEISTFVASMASHGPIALADVHNLEIRNNWLVRCGASGNAALAAISAWAVSGAVIEGNEATANGSADAQPANSYIGGVALRFVTPTRPDDPQGTLGPSALVLHNNRIDCPQGHPIIVAGLGAMSIQHNVLSSALEPSPDIPNIGTGVLVVNGFGTGDLSDSLDDTSQPTPALTNHLVQMHNNQVNLRSVSRPPENIYLYIHGVGAAATDVQGNNFSLDGPAVVISTLLVFGLMSQVQNNQLREVRSFGLFSAINLSTIGKLDNNFGMFCFLLYQVLPVPVFSEGNGNLSVFSVALECSGVIDSLNKALGGTTAPPPPAVAVPPRSYDDRLVEMTQYSETARQKKGVKPTTKARQLGPYDTSKAPMYVEAVQTQQTEQVLSRLTQGAGLLDVQGKALDRTAQAAANRKVGKAATDSRQAAAHAKATATRAREEVFAQVARHRSQVPPSEASLRGRVTDVSGGRVAAGARVTAFDADNKALAVGTVDETGWYTLRVKSAQPVSEVRITDPTGRVLASESRVRVSAGQARVRHFQVVTEVAPEPAVTERAPKPTEPKPTEPREGAPKDEAQLRKLQGERATTLTKRDALRRELAELQQKGGVPSERISALHHEVDALDEQDRKLTVEIASLQARLRGTTK